MATFPTIAGRKEALIRAKGEYHGPSLNRKVVMILDDVLSSGLSLRVASEVLVNAGASLVIPIGVIQSPAGNPLWEKDQTKRVIRKEFIGNLDAAIWEGA